jgi:hypothetical protein
LIPQSLLKTADQLKIKGLCEVPESREGPSVSLSSPPRDSSTPRINFAKLKRHHPRYKRPRTTYEGSLRPGHGPGPNTEPRHHHHHHHHLGDPAKYKEEDFVENYVRDCNKEVSSAIFLLIIASLLLLLLLLLLDGQPKSTRQVSRLT